MTSICGTPFTLGELDKILGDDFVDFDISYIANEARMNDSKLAKKTAALAKKAEALARKALLIMTSSKKTNQAQPQPQAQPQAQPNAIYIFNNGVDGIPHNLYRYIEAVGFFDSLHDFGLEVCDSEGDIKGKKYLLKKFMFTFLLQGGYPELKQHFMLNHDDFTTFQSYYSYFKNFPRSLNEIGLENYFAIGNIYNTIINKTGTNVQIKIINKTKLLKNDTKSIARQTDIYNYLAEFFNEYKDDAFGDKIKLIMDFQSNLNDIMANNNKTGRNFCLLYTAETITDSAPKSKAKSIDDVFGYQNWYIEKLNPDNKRKHNGTDDTIKGNITVEYNNISLSNPQDLQDSNYSVNLTYYYDDERIKIKTETVTMNNKQTCKGSIINSITNFINNIFKTNDKLLIGKNYVDSITKKSNINDRNVFYTAFDSLIVDLMDLEVQQNPFIEYALNYAIKRLGDTLQGKVCQEHILKNMKFLGVILDKKKIVISDQEITPTKGAVLVTHDRMLFAYAIINKIPVILDSIDHMIIYKPDLQELISVQNLQTTGGKPTKNKIGNLLPNTIQKGGNLGDIISSIQTNISSFMHFVMLRKLGNSRQDSDFGLKNISKLLENVNIILYNKIEDSDDNNDVLRIEYITKYEYDVLIIGDNDRITAVTGKLDTEDKVVGRRDLRNTRTSEYLNMVSTWIDIYIDDENYLLVYRDLIDLTLKLEFKYNNKKTESTGNESREGKIPITTFSNKDIRDFLSKSDDKNYHTMMEYIYTIDNYGEMLSDIIGTGVDIISIETVQKEPFYEIEHIEGGGGPNDIPLYEKILDGNFDILNNTDMLLQNNITVLTFLHQLLCDYEISFINYEEGIDTFYCKIDESIQLSYTIGLYNFMPRDIEFYVFLKFLIRDYNTETITTINFALFEYYLYIYKNDNNIYYRFQTIKSYLLDNFYEVSMTEEIKAQLTSEPNIATYEYFEKMMKEVTDTSYTILQEIYSDIQQKNTDYKVTYKNVDEYNLKLCGFSDLQEEFTTKTIDIIKVMVETNSPLITEFVRKAQAQQTIKEGEEETKTDDNKVLVVPFDETDSNNIKQVVPTVENTEVLVSPYKENDEVDVGQGKNPLNDYQITSEAAGGKKHKLSKHKYRKEKNKTKRKRTKRQQTKIKVNQTKKNRKIKKKRNTKRNKE
jgi:hypothetical protein